MDHFDKNIQDTLRNMLIEDVQKRLDIRGVLSGNLFSDIEVRTLKYIASITIKEPVKKV